MVEKQLLATYSAPQAVEPITQTAEVAVKTTAPIQGWVKDLTHTPKTGWPNHKQRTRSPTLVREVIISPEGRTAKDIWAGKISQ